MKKFLWLLLMLVFTIKLNAQDTSGSRLTKDVLMQRAKNQKQVAWILVGGGGLSLLLSVATYKINLSGSFFGPRKEVNNTPSTIFFIAGVGALVSSVPLFVAAKRNKLKAASLTINNQPIFLPNQAGLVMKLQTGVTLKVPL